MPAKNIAIETGDDLKVVIRKISESKARDIVLTVPKKSALGTSLDNFQALKYKSGALKKKISIESVDDRIIEMARLARIEAVNPILNTRERLVYDVFPIKKPAAPKSRLTESTIESENAGNDPHTELETERTRGNRPKRGTGGKSALIVRIAVVCGIAATVFVAAIELPTAKINLALKEFPVELDESVLVATTAAEPNVADGVLVIPGEKLVATKNLALSFPASGKDRVERKAVGIITIYNAYSSSPQTLVATTRLESPTGLIFRLKEKITVPGAEIIDGKIKPSAISAAVEADKPGSEYNTGPVEKWTVPGFANSPRFAGFYGASTGKMAGGFIGEQAVPTDEDIADARAKIAEALKNAAKSEIVLVMKDSFEILDGTTEFVITKEEITPSEPGNNQFSIFAEGTLTQLVFETPTFETALTKIAGERAKTGFPLTSRKQEIERAEIVPDLSAGTVKFKARGSITLHATINPDTLTAELLNKEKQAVRTTVLGLPGLERVTVSLWPFWVTHVPKNAEKVQLTIE